MTKADDGTFHSGFARDRGEGRGVRVSRAKREHLPFPDATEAAARLLAIQTGGTHSEVVKPMKVRKTKLAVLSIPSAILDKGDPAYARTVRMANSYKKARCKELYIAHGYVSSGVSALVSAEALALSASRFIFEYAAENVLDNPQLLKLASSLADSARQNALSAWELCCREAVIRKRNDASNVQSPWLVSSVPGAEIGKKPRGRPRKALPLTVEVVTSAGTDVGGEVESEGQGGGDLPWTESEPVRSSGQPGEGGSQE